MAIKKSELYSSIWESCDELRGGMDASLYKNYVLTLLFVKYVSDRYEGDKYAEIVIPEGGSFDDMIKVKGDKNIGEKLDIIVSTLAKANNLSGIIDSASFNDDEKIGSGKEMVEKLTSLVAIFQNPNLNFKKHRATDDDILGDAYEYLMRHFATQSGKSKGQFYTPAEVSRVIAKVIRIDEADSAEMTLYDPACGSGSLLIRAADEADCDITIYGQEKDISTVGMAKMNLVLHHKASGDIRQGNTLADPKFKDRTKLKKFDYIVANPPFSLKKWSNGISNPDEYERFIGYGNPPAKNGDYAWLLHLIKSMKRDGKGAIVLPHGVLFRGNAEAGIRAKIINKGCIKGIIGLPSNLFLGTGIPACIIVLDKSDAVTRNGIFMIDASKEFMKDGNKNRLREQDIRKIVDVFNAEIEIEKYSRFVPYNEIKEDNAYNLNIPRYIDTSEAEDLQNIEAHLLGGIPSKDIDELSAYWDVYPSLKNHLFESFERKGFLKLSVDQGNIRKEIFNYSEFIDHAKNVDSAYTGWKEKVSQSMYEMQEGNNPKEFIVDIAEKILNDFSKVSLIDKFDIYQHLMQYWQEYMQDDTYAISYDGWIAGREIERELDKKGKLKSFEGRVIPKKIIIEKYFRDEKEAIENLESLLDEVVGKLQEMKEEHGGEDGLLAEVINDKGNISKNDVKIRLKDIKNDSEYVEEYSVLKDYVSLMENETTFKSSIKKANEILDSVVIDKYGELNIEEIKELVIEEKWYRDIFRGIDRIYSTVSHKLANRITELAKRYEKTLPSLENEVDELARKVDAHLERMGYSWK
ncbi:MAG: type I restriction-modification system subunit M [Clostridiales bacterium]|nr:type I restriction-modification system subunit M [Clostridiales bacterium]